MHHNLPKLEKHSVIICPECRRFLSFGLRITHYGKVQTQIEGEYGEQFFTYHRLNYILSGHPYYHSQGRRIDLEPGCLIYLPPNMSLRIDPDKPPVELMFINFEVTALDKLEYFRNFISDIFTHQHVHDKDEDLLNILKTIEQIGAENALGSALEIQNHFENLFFHIVRLSNRFRLPKNTAAPGTGSDILLLAMNYINANMHKRFHLNEMADALNISENYLYKLFVSKTGKSPATFITDLRMDTAKSALANPNLPIKAIASNLGYPDASHFSTAFKRECGMSPRQYRQHLLMKNTDIL